MKYFPDPFLKKNIPAHYEGHLSAMEYDNVIPSLKIHLHYSENEIDLVGKCEILGNKRYGLN